MSAVTVRGDEPCEVRRTAEGAELHFDDTVIVFASPMAASRVGAAAMHALTLMTAK